jgi:hypothetical protein
VFLKAGRPFFVRHWSHVHVTLWSAAQHCKADTVTQQHPEGVRSPECRGRKNDVPVAGPLAIENMTSVTQPTRRSHCRRMVRSCLQFPKRERSNYKVYRRARPCEIKVALPSLEAHQSRAGTGEPRRRGAGYNVLAELRTLI